MINKTWPVTGALDLHRTLRFVVPSIAALLQQTAEWSLYSQATSTGPATVRLHCEAGVLTAQAGGPGAREAIAAVPRTIALDDPGEMDLGVGLLRDLDRKYPGFRLGSTGRVFDTILPVVLGQRVTTDESKQSYRRLVGALGEPAPGESELLLPPRSEAVSALSFDDFHSLGIERARARVVLEVAGRAGRLEEINAMVKDEAERRLGAIRGVGPWTAAQVMGSAWGDQDAVPMGDFHLPNTVAWALAGEPRGDDDRMLELLEPYRPQRRRALLLIKMSGIHAPRYGPRSSKSIISRGGAY